MISSARVRYLITQNFLVGGLQTKYLGLYHVNTRLLFWIWTYFSDSEVFSWYQALFAIFWTRIWKWCCLQTPEKYSHRFVSPFFHWTAKLIVKHVVCESEAILNGQNLGDRLCSHNLQTLFILILVVTVWHSD